MKKYKLLIRSILVQVSAIALTDVRHWPAVIYWKGHLTAVSGSFWNRWEKEVVSMEASGSPNSICLKPGQF